MDGKQFIIVDDDPINNMVCKHTVRRVFEDANVFCFEYPAEGLEYISTKYLRNDDGSQTVLLLDINMPGIDGWDFLEEFEKMPVDIKGSIRIYIVSSSINPKDRERAIACTLVNGYLPKPITAEACLEFK